MNENFCMIVWLAHNGIIESVCLTVDCDSDIKVPRTVPQTSLASERTCFTHAEYSRKISLVMKPECCQLNVRQFLKENRPTKPKNI